MAGIHKGCWLHKLPSTPEEVRGIARRLGEAGFDLIAPCVKQPSGIFDFRSKLGRVREEFRDFDPLAALAEETRGTPLSVHAWCCVFPEGEHSAFLAEHPELEAVPGEEWPRGETQFRWACPNRPEVQDYEAAVYQELLDGYPIAGVHLDYIRFTTGVCFCDYCREDYRRETGGDLGKLGVFGWNDSAAQDMDAWIEWRCAAVTRFVRRIRTAAQAAGKELSAAVFHYYPGGLLDIGQDWEAWVREGLLDYVFPMNYALSTLIAAKWTRNNVATLRGAGGGCRLWEGVHRHASMSTQRFAEHVRSVLAEGAGGFMIFEYPGLSDDDLDALSKL